MKTYRVAHETGLYCFEVPGIPVPNDHGLELFLHRNIEGNGYAVSEVQTGAAIGKEIFEDALFAVEEAEQVLAANRNSVAAVMKSILKQHGPVSEMPLRDIDENYPKGDDTN